MKHYTYNTTGTCSKQINITIDDNGRIQAVSFLGGCNGNLKGIASLVKGEKPSEVISRLKGITCGMKNTSCPDQLATALDQIQQECK